MSLYGALQIGVAGLDAFSTALTVSSSNIANVNTIGYKADTTAFSTLLASSTASGDATQAGVTASQVQHVIAPGNINPSQSPTDLAINGNGFFVVSQTPNVTTGTSFAQFYTRAGNFTPDAGGNLQNAAGFDLLGWRLDAQGNVPSDRTKLVPINLDTLAGKAAATQNMNLQANLQSSTATTAGYTVGDLASGATQADFERTINVFDSQGGPQPLQIAFLKTGANQWSYEITYQGAAANLNPPPANNLIASGTMTFNSDGTLASAVAPPATPSGTFNITIPWDPATSGLQPQTIAVNMGTLNGSDGITQFDSPSSQGTNSIDGALFGNVTGVSVDSNGVVTAKFSNGLSQNVFKIPVVTFPNPDGLTAVSGNAYAASINSGLATVGEANLGAAGSIQSKALEGSNVDLATEFTNLITTQRAYSASTKIITTASEMLDQLLQIAH